MSSLVQELQRDALKQNVTVTELFQECLVVAMKSGIQEFASWVRREIDGYNPGRTRTTTVNPVAKVGFLEVKDR